MERIAKITGIVPYDFQYRRVALNDGSGRDLTIAMTRISRLTDPVPMVA